MSRTLIALLVTVALGIASRRWPIGLWLYDKSLGDVLYAVAAYLGLAIVLPRRPALVAGLALGWCLAVEAFQATGVPARYAHLGVVRWLIGTDFAWHDVACYFVGVAAVLVLDVLVLRRVVRSTTGDIRGE